MSWLFHFQPGSLIMAGKYIKISKCLGCCIYMETGMKLLTPTFRLAHCRLCGNLRSKSVDRKCVPLPSLSVTLSKISYKICAQHAAGEEESQQGTPGKTQ